MNLGMLLSSKIKPELDELREICNFTDEEEIVFTELSKRRSKVYIAEKLSISCSTVSNRIKAIQIKVNKAEEKIHEKSQ